MDKKQVGNELVVGSGSAVEELDELDELEELNKMELVGDRQAVESVLVAHKPDRSSAEARSLMAGIHSSEEVHSLEEVHSWAQDNHNCCSHKPNSHPLLVFLSHSFDVSASDDAGQIAGPRSESGPDTLVIGHTLAAAEYIS